MKRLIKTMNIFLQNKILYKSTPTETSSIAHILNKYPIEVLLYFKKIKSLDEFSNSEYQTLRDLLSIKNENKPNSTINETFDRREAPGNLIFVYRDFYRCKTGENNKPEKL